MKITHILVLVLFVVLLNSCETPGSPDQAAARDTAVSSEDALSLWTDSPRKTAITDFVNAVTNTDSPDFVPEPERVAVFDNDGTLWSEKPIYIQLAFALEEGKKMAEDNPDLASKEPYKSLVAGDIEAVMEGGERALIEIVALTHSGMSSAEFEKTASDWLDEARHPKYDRPYTELTYGPMVQLLDYLRANGFSTYIVSGGGIEFIRYVSDEIYGIPPSQVVGSSLKAEYKMVDGEPVIMRLPEIFFVDDKEGKPVGIQQYIGQKPIAAFGNSDGDFQMLEWTSTNDHKTLCMFVHHTDGEREYAYDREGHVGVLNRGLDESKSRGWHLIDMAGDWEVVFD